ncbi:hypothetical protein [Vibrio alfacsensis]|uniref:hypothetical protein n=1 Tax=Vibrio alfacsensis TaxID=1074311 RepID=UPI00078BC557|nr:hypothetical protein [Vibrio alfacsensis]BAU70900.1 hypothetical protein [Vibrio sp. 04Ya108]BBM67843.1 hypothetical protein VA249_44890 [Vibrio alfacsensis]BCN27013.1 hypothetical protein VYA_42050 [Vibrio alfacsensis]
MNKQVEYEGTSKANIDVKVTYDGTKAHVTAKVDGFRLIPPMTVNTELTAVADYAVYDGWISYSNLQGVKGLFPAHRVAFNVIDNGKLIEFILPTDTDSTKSLIYTYTTPLE